LANSRSAARQMACRECALRGSSVRLWDTYVS
jgi:hypothetical protein